MEQTASRFYLELGEQLDELSDPRRGQGQRCKLKPLLLLLLIGFLRGMKNVAEILAKGGRDAELLEFLGWRRVPAQGTYTNLFSQLSLGEVNAVLRRTGLSLGWSAERVAVDGKTARDARWGQRHSCPALPPPLGTLRRLLRETGRKTPRRQRRQRPGRLMIPTLS